MTFREGEGYGVGDPEVEKNADNRVKNFMGMNAALQQKKNRLRKELSKRGILQKQGTNTFDKYKYFSEAQYKELFTGLFSECGLEMQFSEVGYEQFAGTDKQPFGRIVRIRFTLRDTDTGYGEDSVVSGEGLDKGDKAGYKAYTGALKYWLANTFMVATGDDPEKESPDGQRKCEDCGKTIEDTAIRGGEVWPAAKIISYSMRRFNKALCPDCQKKATKEEE